VIETGIEAFECEQAAWIDEAFLAYGFWENARVTASIWVSTLIALHWPGALIPRTNSTSIPSLQQVSVLVSLKITLCLSEVTARPLLLVAYLH
jgi:hypothetical protein